jgi:proteasome assembly chaperone (PAC2) family protein
MNQQNLIYYRKPALTAPRLVLAFDGWMDGGDVSTGTVRYLRETLSAEPFARIRPDRFYIYNIPGSMEISALFRPPTVISDGLVQSLEMPHSTFSADEQNDIIFFSGKEPNLDWPEYAACIFALCTKLDVTEIYFIGSVAGLTPHTRQARITCSLSDENLKEKLDQPGINFSQYKGPASIVTYLTTQATDKHIPMVNLVAEIPAYVQGYNPKCIETATRILTGLLGLKTNLEGLRDVSDEFEKRLNDIVQDEPELVEKIAQLEQDYDNQIFDTELTDLKDWLHRKGIRLD